MPYTQANGLTIRVPTPTSDGGQALNQNFLSIGQRLAQAEATLSAALQTVGTLGLEIMALQQAGTPGLQAVVQAGNTTTGTITASGFVGPLMGTAAVATTAVAATTAGTASYAITAGTATTASTATFATTAGTASSATLATTANYASTAGTATTASTATFATTAGTASSATLATTASYAINAGTATSATTAGTITGTISSAQVTGLTTPSLSQVVTAGATTTAAITVGGISSTGAVNVTNNVSAVQFNGQFAGSGSGLTAVPATSLTGIVMPSHLGSGLPTSATYLRGDGTWTAVPAPATPVTPSLADVVNVGNTTSQGINVGGTVTASGFVVGTTSYQASGELNCGVNGYTDPQPGVLRDAKFSSNGIAVGGTIYAKSGITSAGNITATSVNAGSLTVGVTSGTAASGTIYFGDGFIQKVYGSQVYIGGGLNSDSLASYNNLVVGLSNYVNGMTNARGGIQNDIGSTLDIYGGTSGVTVFHGAVTAASDIEVNSTSSGLVLHSPNGSRWRISVSNAGVLATTSL